jgi:hypothetical protein
MIIYNVWKYKIVIPNVSYVLIDIMNVSLVLQEHRKRIIPHFVMSVQKIFHGILTSKHVNVIKNIYLFIYIIKNVILNVYLVRMENLIGVLYVHQKI